MRWPLGLDASITPNPAEPTTTLSIKALAQTIETERSGKATPEAPTPNLQADDLQAVPTGTATDAATAQAQKQKARAQPDLFDTSTNDNAKTMNEENTTAAPAAPGADDIAAAVKAALAAEREAEAARAEAAKAEEEAAKGALRAAFDRAYADGFEWWS